MKRKNQASFSQNLLFLREQKGRNFEETPLGLAVFFLEYTFVYKMKKCNKKFRADIPYRNLP